MRRFSLALLAIFLIALLSACSLPGSGGGGQNGGAGGSNGGSSTHYNVGASSNCQSGTGQPTTCQVVLTNDASSTGDFQWSASSSAPGTNFNPSSGTLAPGARSDPIQVTVPEGECPFVLTFAEGQIAGVDVKITSC